MARACVGVSAASLTVARAGPAGAALNVNVTIGAGMIAGQEIATPRKLATNGRPSTIAAILCTSERFVITSGDFSVGGGAGPNGAAVIATSSTRACAGTRWAGRRGAE